MVLLYCFYFFIIHLDQHMTATWRYKSIIERGTIKKIHNWQPLLYLYIDRQLFYSIIRKQFIYLFIYFFCSPNNRYYIIAFKYKQNCMSKASKTFLYDILKFILLFIQYIQYTNTTTWLRHRSHNYWLKMANKLITSYKYYFISEQLSWDLIISKCQSNW